MNPINFIKASKEHIPLLVDSRIAFLSEYWGQQEPEKENKLREELYKFLEEEIPAETYITWLAMDGGRCVGTGGMKVSKKPGSFRIPDGLNGYIMNMFTLPEYRRRGIAETILNLLIEEGRKKGIKFFELHATEEGEPLYIKNNFVIHKEPTYRKFFIE